MTNCFFQGNEYLPGMRFENGHGVFECQPYGAFEMVTDVEVKGVGPDAPIVENEKGGKQSATPYRFDLIPSDVAFDVAETLAQGAEKYGAKNWMLIPVQDHINHALAHVFAFQAGDTTDEHLTHAIVRLIFAAHLDKQEF